MSHFSKVSNRQLILLLAVLSLSLVLSCSPATEETAVREVKQYTIDQFMRTVTIGGASFSADESKAVFASDKTGHTQVYVVEI